MGDGAEPELQHYTGHLSPPTERGAHHFLQEERFSLKFATSAGPGPRLAEPVSPSGRAQAAAARLSSPAAPRGPPATATAGRAHSRPSASSCRSSWSNERSAPRGEKKGPVSAPGIRRASPAARPPGPAAPPRAWTPRRLLHGRHPEQRRRAHGRAQGGAGAAAPPGEQGATYPPSCGRPLLLGLPGIRDYMERREPGSRWTRAGGAARRRDGPAGTRARGAGRGPGTGPRAGRLADAGGRRTPRTPRAPGLAPPCLAVPCGPGAAGASSSRLPRSGPSGARSHPRPEAPHAERSGRRRARCRRPGTLRRVPGTGAGRGLPRPGPLCWVTGLAHRLIGRSPSSLARRSPPRAPFPGLHVHPRRSEARRRPGGGRGSHPPGGGSTASPRAGGLCEVTGNKAQGLVVERQSHPCPAGFRTRHV